MSVENLFLVRAVVFSSHSNCIYRLEITMREDNPSSHESVRFLACHFLKPGEDLIVDELGPEFFDQFFNRRSASTSAANMPGCEVTLVVNCLHHAILAHFSLHVVGVDGLLSCRGNGLGNWRLVECRGVDGCRHVGMWWGSEM